MDMIDGNALHIGTRTHKHTRTELVHTTAPFEMLMLLLYLCGQNYSNTDETAHGLKIDTPIRPQGLHSFRRSSIRFVMLVDVCVCLSACL